MGRLVNNRYSKIMGSKEHFWEIPLVWYSYFECPRCARIMNAIFIVTAKLMITHGDLCMVDIIMINGVIKGK